jgi:hypothetical protein
MGVVYIPYNITLKLFFSLNIHKALNCFPEGKLQLINSRLEILMNNKIIHFIYKDIYHLRGRASLNTP